MNDVELLRDGLAKIEAGWVQGALSSIDPENGILCHCALGAMGVETLEIGECGNPELDRATELLWPALPQDAQGLICYSSEDIWEFNDRYKNTVDDVKAMFHRAIAIAEAK